nr:aminotransferase class I/II-fold pyridoxal phosphate-dependent enzyme [Monaibacterium marinum]
MLTPELPPQEDWLGYLKANYDSGVFANFGPNVRALADEMSEVLGGARQVCMTSSATSGLSAVLMALGIRGTVAVPSFTFPATASAVFQAGAMPVGIEANPQSWEMDPTALRARLGAGDIEAVVHVRSFGYCRNLDVIEDICAEHNIPLIVDAAAAFGGAEPDGQLVGHRGVAEVVSLHATKPFAAGEGGAVLASPELISEVKNAINFALQGGLAGDRWGLNGKMSEFSAAVGRAALVRLPDVIEFRRAQADYWLTLLQDLDGVAVPQGHGAPPWQLFACRMLGRDASAIRATLADNGVESRVYYSPTVASRWSETPPRMAEVMSRDMLSLPMGRHLSRDDQRYVAELLSQILAKTPSVVNE